MIAEIHPHSVLDSDRKLSSAYNNSIHHFCVIGMNYRSSDTGIRSRFSIASHQYPDLIQLAAFSGISGCMALSTCNRTEIYGMCQDAMELIEPLCKIKQCSIGEFIAQGYVYQGFSAIKHLFQVASGLDSQIIGDTEILSQLKIAAKIAKQQGAVTSTMERIINSALQASKEIRTKTSLNSGTVSVSYAAIEIIREKFKDINGKKILVVGSGKFGNRIAKNLKQYLGGASVSFTNRTDEKAFHLAMRYDAGFVSYRHLPAACDDADAIIVNTSAEVFTILPSFFKTIKQRLVLDLSMPQNVHREVRHIEAISLWNVDEVSKFINNTIALRKAAVSKATDIINDTLDSLIAWHRLQSNSPFLHLVKTQLYQLNEVYGNSSLKAENIHRAVSSLALKLKYKTNKGCQCINTLNNFLQMKE